MKDKEIAVIILGAGQGSRMQSEMPKVLHHIGGKPMVEHVLDMALSLRPTKIVTVLRRGMDEIQNMIHPVSEVVIQEKQLGTADAVKVALNNLKGFRGQVLILYADTPMISRHTIQKMRETLDADTSIVVLGFHLTHQAEYGRIVATKNAEILRIVEYRDASESEREITLCNSGVILTKCSLLSAIIEDIDNDNAKGEYYLTDIVKIANEKGHTSRYIDTDESEVIGVNNRFELARAEAIYQDRLRQSMMLQGVTLIAPETVFLSYDIKVGRDIIIHPHVVFGPDVIIEDGVEIMPFTHIAGSHIGRGSVVGPYARLRPGTELANNVKIGNFVELKQAEIREDSKISHLSYIGDATVGRGSNIGAGTITCNYDGFKKHKTTIGNNVFIGSNTSLVAPIHVGDGALIGAGSTLRKDVERDELVVTDNNMVSKKEGAVAYRDKKQADAA